MATIDLGKIKPLYKGVYQSNTSFEPLDFTIFADVLYINKQACSGIEPTDTAYFDPVNISSNGLLTLLKQVDGHLSGLDADTVDGKHAEELQDKITGAASTITAADLPANIVLISTAEGKVTASTITAEELFLLQGVTLNIQQQLNYKQATIIGAASSVTTSNLSPSMVVVTTPDGKIAASATISAAELSYLEGVTSAIQTQLDAKLGLLDLVDYLEKIFVTPNTVLVANADGKATSSSISTTTLGYLSGSTSNIQSQLDLKVAKDSNTGAALLPSGTTAQRPTAGAAKLRFNTELAQFEGHNGTAWGPLGDGGGYRNLIINGGFQVNQRAYVSGTATTTANQYTLDRWRVVTSGKNLVFSTSAGKVTVTAPADGIEQVIEGAFVQTGTYVINWEGNATCTVNGTARTKGSSFSITGGANIAVKFSGGTVANVQFESGSVATPFEQRPFGLELVLCQRYYEVTQVNAAGYGVAGMSWRTSVPFKVMKRVEPTILVVTQTGYTNIGTISTTGTNPNSVITSAQVVNNGAFALDTALNASAEL